MIVHPSIHSPFYTGEPCPSSVCCKKTETVYHLYSPFYVRLCPKKWFFAKSRFSAKKVYTVMAQCKKNQKAFHYIS